MKRRLVGGRQKCIGVGAFPSGNQRWLGHPLPKKVYSWENHLQKCVLFNCHVCLLAGIPIKYEASGLDFGQFFFGLPSAIKNQVFTGL